MADPRPDLPPMPEGWTVTLNRPNPNSITQFAPYWHAESDNALLAYGGEDSVVCETAVGIPVAEWLAVLAHLRALSTRDATTGEGER